MDSSPNAQRYNPEITLTTTSSTPVTYTGSTNISSLVDQLTHIKQVSASSRNLSLDLSSGFVSLGLNRAAIFTRSQVDSCGEPCDERDCRSILSSERNPQCSRMRKAQMQKSRSSFLSVISVIRTLVTYADSSKLLELS